MLRRSIGTAKLRNFSPFLMLDHFTIGKGAGFPDHPHRSMARNACRIARGTDMSVMGKTVGVGIFKLRWFV
jgi:hypothetical protein